MRRLALSARPLRGHTAACPFLRTRCWTQSSSAGPRNSELAKRLRQEEGMAVALRRQSARLHTLFDVGINGQIWSACLKMKRQDRTTAPCTYPLRVASGRWLQRLRGGVDLLADVAERAMIRGLGCFSKLSVLD